MHYFLLFAAALCAGAINSVAGGGTLLTFPALLSAGVLPVTANATSTVALVPGSLSAFWGYRTDLGGARSDLLRWAIPSLLGGAVGAALLVRVGDKMFSHLVPYLILTATGLFLAQEPLRRLNARRNGESTNGADNPRGNASITVPGMVFQFFVAVYGGFFGAGIGILMLATLGLMGHANIHRSNGLKNFAAVCINGVAAMLFILGGRVDWRLAGLMMTGAVLGGFGGVGLAQKLGQKNVRRLVVCIGLSMAAYTLLRPA